MRKPLAVLLLLGAILALSEGCAPIPLPHYAAYKPQAGRGVAGRLREPPPGRRRMGAVLVPRPALAHDPLPDPRRPRPLIPPDGRDPRIDETTGRRRTPTVRPPAFRLPRTGDNFSIAADGLRSTRLDQASIPPSRLIQVGHPRRASQVGDRPSTSGRGGNRPREVEPCEAAPTRSPRTGGDLADRDVEVDHLPAGRGDRRVRLARRPRGRRGRPAARPGRAVALKARRRELADARGRSRGPTGFTPWGCR